MEFKSWIELDLRGSKRLAGRYAEGASVKQLIKVVLGSAWAQKALPWNVYLRMAFPKKVALFEAC